MALNAWTCPTCQACRHRTALSCRCCGTRRRPKTAPLQRSFYCTVCRSSYCIIYVDFYANAGHHVQCPTCRYKPCAQ